MKQKLLLALAAGAGFAAGYYICYVKTRKVVEAEIEDMMQYVEKKKESKTVIEPDLNEKEAANNVAEAAEKIMKDNGYIPDEEMNVKIEKEEEKAMVATPMDDEIYLIDESCYNEEYHEFDKIEVTYYQKDHVYVDPAGNPVIAPEDVFSDLIEVIQNEGDDGDMFFIRNTNIAADFAITIRNEAYSEGMFEEGSV